MSPPLPSAPLRSLLPGGGCGLSGQRLQPAAAGSPPLPGPRRGQPPPPQPAGSARAPARRDGAGAGEGARGRAAGGAEEQARPESGGRAGGRCWRRGGPGASGAGRERRPLPAGAGAGAGRGAERCGAAGTALPRSAPSPRPAHRRHERPRLLPGLPGAGAPGRGGRGAARLVRPPAREGRGSSSAAAGAAASVRALPGPLPPGHPPAVTRGDSAAECGSVNARVYPVLGLASSGASGAAELCN